MYSYIVQIKYCYVLITHWAYFCFNKIFLRCQSGLVVDFHIWVSVHNTFFSKYFLILLLLSLTTLLLFNLIIFFRHLIILRQKIHIYLLTVKYKNFLFLKLGKAWQNLNALPIFPLYQRCNILLRLQTFMERIN